MATRQYIGARYTPKFSGTYNNTQAYEALEVVDNGSGTTYIARKPVPPNTPLTNTEYWLVYGSSSGAILDLQSRVGEIEEDLPVIKSSILTMGGQIAANTSDITSLKGRATTLESKVATLEQHTKGNIIVIGNSYVGYGCADEIKTHYDAAFQRIYGGGGFVTYAGHDSTYAATLQEELALMTDEQKAGVNTVLFVSAMGDSRALQEKGTAYLSALQSTITAIEGIVADNLPNCEKIMVTLAETRDVVSFADNSYSNLFRLHKHFRRYFGVSKIAYIGWSGFNILFSPSDMQSDHYHPNNSGCTKIGHEIYKQSIGIESYTRKSSVRIDTPCGYNSGATMRLQSIVTPDMSMLVIDALTPAVGDVTIVADSLLVTTHDLDIPVPLFGEQENKNIKISRGSTSFLDGVCFVQTDSSGCMQLFMSNVFSKPTTISVRQNAFLEGNQIVSM